MKLELVEKKHKVEDGKEYTAEYYTLGGYEVDHYTTTYTDGTVWDRVQVSHIDFMAARKNYLPDISFEDGDSRWSDGRGFKIQTTAYGTLNPDEIQRVIDGYNTAMEAVKILTAEFC